MARRQLLTDEQWTRLLAPPSDEREIVRYWTLSREDFDIIFRKRSDHSRLGFALLLCYLRYIESASPEALCFAIIHALSNELTQAEAVAVFQAEGLPVTLDTLQNWKIGRRTPRGLSAVTLSEFLKELERNLDSVAQRCAQHGPVEEVFRRPSTPAIATIVAVETIQRARVLQRTRNS